MRVGTGGHPVREVPVGGRGDAAAATPVDCGGRLTMAEPKFNQLLQDGVAHSAASTAWTRRRMGALPAARSASSAAGHVCTKALTASDRWIE